MVLLMHFQLKKRRRSKLFDDNIKRLHTNRSSLIHFVLCFISFQMASYSPVFASISIDQNISELSMKDQQNMAMFLVDLVPKLRVTSLALCITYEGMYGIYFINIIKEIFISIYFIQVYKQKICTVMWIWGESLSSSCKVFKVLFLKNLIIFQPYLFLVCSIEHFN